MLEMPPSDDRIAKDKPTWTRPQGFASSVAGCDPPAGVPDRRGVEGSYPQAKQAGGDTSGSPSRRPKERGPRLAEE